MVDIAQLVRAPDCDSGGRRFESGYPPHFYIQVKILYTTEYGELSKWGRLRALPVADEASNKEWQRSEFCA